jgi:hypothetical protein
VNCDRCVDDADLLQVLFNFGGDDPNSDINGDGVVDDADLLHRAVQLRQRLLGFASLSAIFPAPKRLGSIALTPCAPSPASRAGGSDSFCLSLKLTLQHSKRNRTRLPSPTRWQRAKTAVLHSQDSHTAWRILGLWT